MMNLVPWRRRNRENGGELMRQDPISTLWSEMDRLFDQVAGESAWPETREWLPALDVCEDDKEVSIRAEIPGVDPKELDVSVAGKVLTISGEKKHEHEEQQKGFYRSERHYGTFRRSVELPRGVNPDSVSADYRNGVLTVHLKKDESMLPKKVSVKALGSDKQ